MHILIRNRVREHGFLLHVPARHTQSTSRRTRCAPVLCLFSGILETFSIKHLETEGIGDVVRVAGNWNTLANDKKRKEGNALLSDEIGELHTQEHSVRGENQHIMRH